MITPLSQELETLRLNGSIRNLEAVMEKCSSPNPVVSITIVGCGDAFIQRYWPTLLQYVNRRQIVLTLADQGPLEQLVSEKVGALETSQDPKLKAMAEKLRRSYAEVQSFVDINNKKPVQYFDLTSDEGRHRYERLHVTDFVFILVPDHIHLKEAKKWLPRASIIFVEKPYASTLKEAIEFEEEYHNIENSQKKRGGNAFVVPFDHYFAKITEFLKVFSKGKIYDDIGRIQSIEFYLTESRPPETHRTETLRGGLISDLYPHVLAVLSPFTRLGFENRAVKVARLQEGGIPTETYASLQCTMRDLDNYPVDVTAIIGKGIGESDEKYVLIKGEHGAIVINFAEHKMFGKPQVYLLPKGADGLTPETMNGHGLVKVYNSGHAEFIETLLSGRYLEEPCGGLRREQAHQIMQELDHLRNQVGRLHSIPEYSPKSSKEEIFKKAKELG